MENQTRQEITPKVELLQVSDSALTHSMSPLSWGHHSGIKFITAKWQSTADTTLLTRNTELYPGLLWQPQPAGRGRGQKENTRGQMAPSSPQSINPLESPGLDWLSEGKFRAQFLLARCFMWSKQVTSHVTCGITAQFAGLDTGSGDAPKKKIFLSLHEKLISWCHGKCKLFSWLSIPGCQQPFSWCSVSFLKWIPSCLPPKPEKVHFSAQHWTAPSRDA